MADIVPKSKAKGVDICAQNAVSKYIIRSDLGCYMFSRNLHEGLNLEVYELHPSCKDGDHYLATEQCFFIIKGNSFRSVTNLTKDTGASVYTLHPNCRGGDHYLSAYGIFYIVFQSRGVFRQTNNLATDEGGIQYNLHPNCKDGLYYWGTDQSLYLLKPKGDWGTQFYVTNNILENYNPQTYSVHPDVLNFLPGGLAVTHTPAFGRWDLIKTIANDSDTPITWEKRITRKVGYTKSKSSSIEHNWKIGFSATFESGDLAKLIAKFQFSFSAEYGGSSVNTDSQSWEEATEMEEKVNLTMEPHKKMYVWQYKLGFGKEDVLFCRDLVFDDDPQPPTYNPLPPSNM